MERNYSTEIANMIKNCLDRDDMHYVFNEEEGYFKFDIGFEGSLKNVSYLIIVNEDEYIVRVKSPLGPRKDDAEKLHEMAEFVCRANAGLRNGNFELDFNDGEICFKCYVNCEECMPSMKMVKDSVYHPAFMFDRYGEGMVQVLFAGKSPAEAVQFCEGGSVQMSDEVSEQMRELLAQLRLDELEDEE